MDITCLKGTIRKTRAEAWWNQLEPDQRYPVFKRCELLTLPEGVEWLKSEHKIETSPGRLGVWLNKIRIDLSNATQTELVRDDRDRATLMGGVMGAATAITGANVTLIAQAVFEEFRKPAEKRDEQRLVNYMQLALKARAHDLKSRVVELDGEKFKAAIRTKLQMGLDALAKEIQRNKRALVKYQELKEELAKAA